MGLFTERKKDLFDAFSASGFKLDLEDNPLFPWEGNPNHKYKDIFFEKQKRIITIIARGGGNEGNTFYKDIKLSVISSVSRSPSLLVRAQMILKPDSSEPTYNIYIDAFTGKASGFITKGYVFRGEDNGIRAFWGKMGGEPVFDYKLVEKYDINNLMKIYIEEMKKEGVLDISKLPPRLNTYKTAMHFIKQLNRGDYKRPVFY